LAAAGFAAMLAGCSATQLADSMPSGVAEPVGTPARPAVDYQYPAVHDMPPARPDQPLTAEQQTQMERDLTSIRDRQEGHKASAADKKAAQTAKKPPGDPNETGTAGSKPNP
jgi:hypothetical protein